MKIIEGGLENVPGYIFSAIECGIRYKDRLDYSLIVSNNKSIAAGLFTTNKVFAAPVKVCRERIDNKIKAILINATNANACTGNEGYLNTIQITGDIASELNLLPEEILMASTGIIGHQLPLTKMLDSHEKLIANLSRENGTLIPEAIMTTDTIPKMVSVSIETTSGEYIISGTAKGSGMIAPDMATLLSFILTDAPVGKNDLDRILKNVINESMNAITIDGDMSTNDTVLILSPESDKTLSEQSDLREFEDGLRYVCKTLSKMLVADGEGVTKVVTIKIKNALNSEDAKKAGKSVAESLLVKTAFFGEDPNWGRIVAAAGYSGVDVDQDKLSVFLGDILIFSDGLPSDCSLKAIEALMKNDEILLTIDLAMGKFDYSIITSDISHDYIKINAEYST